MTGTTLIISEPELTTDECIAILEDNIKFALNYKKDIMMNFNRLFEYSIDTNKNKGFIKCRKTGIMFKFISDKGLKIAFHRSDDQAYNVDKTLLNRFVLYKEFKNMGEANNLTI